IVSELGEIDRGDAAIMRSHADPLRGVEKLTPVQIRKKRVVLLGSSGPGLRFEKEGRYEKFIAAKPKLSIRAAPVSVAIVHIVFISSHLQSERLNFIGWFSRRAGWSGRT